MALKNKIIIKLIVCLIVLVFAVILAVRLLHREKPGKIIRLEPLAVMGKEEKGGKIPIEKQEEK